ncbi:MAG: isoprenylcysteine carboxylmethyltransferase family protein [Ilumatobacter sp.]
MSDRSTGWVFVAVQAVLLVALIILPGGDDFDRPSWLRIATDVLFWSGVSLAVLAGLTLGRALTATPVPNASAQLRTSGPYRFARHPIYSGVILIVIAMAARSGSLLTVALAILTLGFFVVKSNWEEARLRERFERYDAYATRTGRFFPCI